MFKNYVDEIKIDEINLDTLFLNSRPDDGFVNATALCKVKEKHFKNWMRLESTKLLIDLLINEIKQETNEEVNVVEITEGKNGISWIHPNLVVSLALWICPKFKCQVAKLVNELNVKGTVSRS